MKIQPGLRSTAIYLLSVLFFLGFVAIGCDGEEEEEESLENSRSLDGVAGTIMLQPKMSPPVEDNTPKNYQAAFALARLRLANDQLGLIEAKKRLGLTDNLAQQCNSLYDGETEQTKWLGCRAAMNVKENYFVSNGPTNIANLLTMVDSRMSDIFRNTDWSYMPCFDSSNTAGGTYRDNSEEQSYDKYQSYEFGPSFSFEDGFSFDLNFTATLSCYSPLSGPNSGTSWVAFGEKDGRYYIYDGQERGTGSLAAVDKDGDVELYMAVGNAIDDFPDTVAEEIEHTKSSSTGIIHLKSTAASGMLEASVAGMGETDCKTHFITNGTLMYIETNTNDYGACTSDDTWVGQVTSNSDGEALAYDASKANLNFCLDVSNESNVTAYDSLDKCTDVGLVSDAFTIKTLDRATFPGKYGPYLLNRDVKDQVPQVKYVPLNDDPLKGSDIAVANFGDGSSDPLQLETTCSGGDTASIDVTHTLSVSTFLNGLVSEIQSGGNVSEDFDADEFKSFTLKSLQTGSPKVKFTLAGSTSAVKWSDFDATVAVSLDGSSLASESYTEPDDRTKSATLGELDVDLSSLTESSVLTLTTSGTLSLGCSVSSASGSASFRVGYPRVEYTAKSDEEASE